MENNEDYIQVVQNIQNQEKKKKKRGIPTSVFIIVLIIVALFCISIGILLGTNDELFKKTGTQSNSSETVTVTNVVSSEKNGKQLLIEGKDKDGKTIWSYTTPSENIPMQVTNEGIKFIETRKGKVYLCDWGKLYILDEQTGEVVAKNTEENIGAARAYTFDDDDNLYTVSYLSALNKFDSNAKLIKSTFDVWNEGFAWPKSMSIDGNNLTIVFEEGTATVKKDTLTITDTKKATDNNSDENKTNNTNNTTNNNTTTANEYAKEYIKIIDQVKAEYPDSELKCDLVYFNNDNTPDLVIGVEGYWTSLYMYENGTVYNLMDYWPYGAMGNAGYSCFEKKGAILNYNSDHAGAIVTRTVAVLNSNHDFDYITYTYCGVNADTESLPDEVQKDLKEYGGYYYNNTKITEDEYNNKLKALSINIEKNNSKILHGTKTIEQMKQQLQK